MSLIQADPFPLEFDAATTALLIIDMQRDFVLPGGFGEKLGNDTSLLLAAVGPTQHVLGKAREKGMFIVHTREGHRPDLSDCPPSKLTRGGKRFIGTDGLLQDSPRLWSDGSNSCPRRSARLLGASTHRLGSRIITRY